MNVHEKAALPVNDSHAHAVPILWSDSLEVSFIAMLRSQNMKWLTICTGGLEWEILQKEVALAKKLHVQYPDCVSWATSFNLSNWGNPAWEKEAIECIGDGFNNGAVAVKVWKEVGMVLRNPDSGFVMIDDPRFDPVLDFIESRDKTLVCHLGEPRNCWLPLESMTVNGDRSYFRNNPEYHAYLHPEIPDYWKQIDARDRMLEKHPDLRVVGCHLGSLEFDTDELAKRLDKYPNFAVDMAARIVHFKIQDREKVRNFIIKYQDRLLYGTDLSAGHQKNFEDELNRTKQVYLSDYKYFATDEEMELPEISGKIRGLALPPEVVRKIFYTNAVRWYPGI